VKKFVKKENKWLIAYDDGDRSNHSFRPEKWKVFANQHPRLLKTFLSLPDNNTNNS
jgi:hypothetical protein